MTRTHDMKSQKFVLDAPTGGLGVPPAPWPRRHADGGRGRQLRCDRDDTRRRHLRGPGWIHRRVDVGDDRFVTMFADPADSGQDYGVIEEAGGMSARVVVDDDGGWKLVDDERYTGR